tara:strand:- start:347 stop:736 length:390 start_codon:yes stop_codon:yes gene_type:complete
MAILSRAINKTRFETGDVPTQSQYIDLLDSTYFKEEGLGDLISVTNSYEIVIPANRLLARIVVYTQNGTAIISLGDTLGTKEYLSDETVLIDSPRVFDIDPIFSIAGQSVYLTFGAGGVAIGELVYYIQ